MSLEPDMTYTFNLYARTHLKLKNSNEIITSIGTIVMTTNNIPLPGTFQVSPTSGIELNDIFTFSVQNWEDYDLPLSYLYGFRQNKDSIKESNQIIIVEGYMDVISLYAKKISNAIASLGTALSENQIKNVSFAEFNSASSSMFSVPSIATFKVSIG